MITTLSGNNQLELKRVLNKVVEKFIDEHGELAVERIDGEEAGAQAMIDAVQSLPFLAQRKLVIVRNLSSNKEAGEAIEQIIGSAADSTDLIFIETAPDKRTAFYKVLKSKTEFREFNELDPRDLPKWVAGYVIEQGGSVSQTDVRYLIDRVGANQRLLASELDKLVTYEPKITKKSIDLLTEKTPQSKVFDLLDAAFAGNKRRALELYEEQRAQKVEPQEITAMLAWQLRLLSLAKLGVGKSSSEIAKDASLNPYPVSKAQALSSKISLNKLRDMVNEAAEIDRLSKSTSIDLDEALRSYIITVL